MNAEQTSQFFIRFTGPFSPWWLLLALPLTLLLGWYLYRKQLVGQDTYTSWGLFGLRAVLLGLLLVLVFQPDFVLRTVKTFPGRVLVMLDDSESMTTADNNMPASVALYIDRKINGASGKNATYHQSAAHLQKAIARLRSFERFSEDGDREKESFWNRAEEAEKKIRSAFQEVEKRVSGVNSQSDGPLLNELQNLRQGLSPFFSGSSHPGKQAFDSFYATSRELVNTLLKKQWDVDQNRIDNGAQSLRQRIKNIRSTSRLNLLKQILDSIRDTAAEYVPTQELEFTRLMKEDQRGDGTNSPEDLEAVKGPSDILGRLRTVLEKDRTFPLSGLILFSDGRHIGKGTTKLLGREFKRQNISLFTGRAGSTNEPIDLSFLDVITPPFAVSGQNTRVSTRVKTALDKPRDVEFRIKKGEEVVHRTTKKVGTDPVETVELSFAPSGNGLVRYTVDVESTGREAFPVRNNRMDFSIHVRQNKINVLLLDWKPRWETRFAMNVYQRLESVRLNSIVKVVQPEGTVRRGNRRGAWPEDRASLAMYDLVVLGPRSKDILDEQEWEDLSSYVTDEGGTVVHLSSNVFRTTSGQHVLPNDLREKLFPLNETFTEQYQQERDWDSASKLQVGSAGAYHPATRGYLGNISYNRARPAKVLSEHSFTYLQRAEDGAPVLAARHAGKGKLFLIGHEHLWKALNPTMIGAHARQYLGLITWALQGGSVTSTDKPNLVLDQRSVRSRDGMQVWVRNVSEDGNVLAINGEEVLSKAPIRNWRSGPNEQTRRAVFETLPPEDITFRLEQQKNVSSSRVVVTERYEELYHLSQNKPFMNKLADAGGGMSRLFVEFRPFLASMQSRERVEVDEDVWQLWDLPVILLLIAVLLTVEWVWRKFVGLI